MKKLLLSLTLSLTGAPLLWAQTNDPTALEKRLDVLEQQVAILKRQIEINKEDTSAQAVTSPTITANNKEGFSIKSPDNNYILKIGGYTQVLAREFGDNKRDLGYESSIIPRRVRLIIQGTVAHDFDFFLQPDFGYNNAFSNITSTTPSAYGVALQDAWLSWKYFPEATIKAGKFKPPFDLENLQDTRYTSFPELGITGNLSPSRDVGVQVSGSLLNDRLNYAVGFFDGAADRENNYGGYSTTAGGDTNNKSGTGRVFIKPFIGGNIEALSGLGIGFAASYGKEKGSDLPTYVTTGQAPIFTYNSNVSAAGPQLRTEPQANYYYKSLGLLGEYVTSSEELEFTSGGVVNRIKPKNKAWSITGTYVLTGEDASYNGVIPRHDFNLSKGDWGAFELAGRFGELKLDHSIFDNNFASLNTSVNKATAWAIGLNWYLNRNIKLAFDFEQTKFSRGAPNGNSTDDRKTENLFSSLAQLSF